MNNAALFTLHPERLVEPHLNTPSSLRTVGCAAPRGLTCCAGLRARTLVDATLNWISNVCSRFSCGAFYTSGAAAISYQHSRVELHDAYRRGRGSWTNFILALMTAGCRLEESRKERSGEHALQAFWTNVTSLGFPEAEIKCDQAP